MRRLVIALVLVATRANARPLVLDDGELEAALTVELNVAPGQIGHSTTIAPDVWYGVAPGWTVGLIHSDASVDRFAPGGSLCVAKTDVSLYGGCDRTYAGGGLDVRWGALPWLAPRARFIERHLVVWKPSVTLGALAQWTHGRFAITGDPYLQIGLANRDRGNGDRLMLPIMGTVAWSRWAFDLATGYDAELATWSDGYRIPVAGRVRADVSGVELGVALGFDALLGPVNTGKERVVMLSAATRWQL